MIKKTYKNIFLILIILTITFSIIPSKVFASSHSASEIVSDADSFINKGTSRGGDAKIDETNIKNTSNTIYNILLVIGIIIAVIIGLVLGIQFIMGGVEQKAEIKGKLMPYVVGCVVIFGAFGIWKIVVDILQAT